MHRAVLASVTEVETVAARFVATDVDPVGRASLATLSRGAPAAIEARYPNRAVSLALDTVTKKPLHSEPSACLVDGSGLRLAFTLRRLERLLLGRR
jgi:hypothetical protein